MSSHHEKPAITNGALVPEVIPEDLAIEIRVQTSYLLSTTELKEPAATWLGMLESGVNKSLEINLALRQYIKSHTAR